MLGRLIVINGLLLLTLAGIRFADSVEVAPLTQKDFLRPLALPYHGWKTTDIALSPAETEILEPDASLIRRYVSPRGDMAELAVVAGHKKRTVHTPNYCMPRSGWEVVSQRRYVLPIPNREIIATRAVMMNGKGQHLITTYYYTDGEFSTNNLGRFQSEQLLKRLKKEIPLGALVRTLVPVRTDIASAEALSDDFAKATLPKVMQTLREVRATR